MKILGTSCSAGKLDVSHKWRRVMYTFNLERHAHVPCEADRAEVVVENELVRVYSRDGIDQLGEPETVFYACRFDSGQQLRIGRKGCGDAYSACYYLEHARLAGDKAAYVSGYHPDRYGNWAFELNVLDTATWSVEPQFTESVRFGGGGESGYTHVTDVALKDNGSVAWITRRRDYTGAPDYTSAQTYEVRKTDTSGPNLLDSDPGIDEDSLELFGSTLQWSVNGEPRSATVD